MGLEDRAARDCRRWLNAATVRRCLRSAAYLQCRCRTLSASILC
jgi:hypothetical protein